MSHLIWRPGAAGPLDELVSRLTRMVQQFAEEHGLEQARVCLELADGSRHTLASLSSDPGFGFFSFVPHGDDEPRRVVVPIGAVKIAEICVPDEEQPFGFAAGPP